MLKLGFPLWLLWLFPTMGHAMADPSNIFQPYVAETVTYNDNLFFRSSSPLASPLPSGASRDDMINQATVGGTVNYTLGHQKLNLNLSVSDNRFVNNQFLNNISSNDRAAWQWQLGKQLSGEVGYAYTRAMGGFTNTNFLGLNIVTWNNAFTNLSYSWHPRWKVRTGLSWQTYTNSATSWVYNDQEFITPSAALIYTAPSNNSLGFEYSYINGKYPNRQLDSSTLIDNKYQQHSINATLKWKFTEKVGFIGIVGYITRLYPDYSQRDYSGETYDLTFNWTPSAKTALALNAWRRLGYWTDVTASYVITEGVSLSPMWQVSPKLALTAKISRQTQDYTGDQIKIGAPTRQDTILNGAVSLIYKPSLDIDITLGYTAGKRDTVNPPPGSGPLDYTFNSAFSTVTLKF